MSEPFPPPIASIRVDEDSPRQVILDALNEAGEMRAVGVVWMTHGGLLKISTTGDVLAKFALAGMFAAHIAKKVTVE